MSQIVIALWQHVPQSILPSTCCDVFLFTINSLSPGSWINSLSLSWLSLPETRSRYQRAQPSFPMAPLAWSRGTPLSTLQNGPYRTQQSLLTGDLMVQGRQWGRFSPARSQTQAPFSPQPRTVLELGSGAGLTGLAICKTCRPSAYIFSDCHSCVLEQLRRNILLNGHSLEADATDPERNPGHTCDSESPRVTVAQLDWDVVTASQLAAFQPEVVIAAGTASPSLDDWSGSTQLSALGKGEWVLPGQRSDEIFRRAIVGSRVTSKHRTYPLEAVKPQPSRLTQWLHVLSCKWFHQINEPSFSQQSLRWREQAPGHQLARLTY